jgi:hypothetical protein
MSIFAKMFAVLGVLVLCLHSFPVWADTQSSIGDDPRFGDIWKQSQILRDQPSIDATPVEFSIAGVNYRVPRNYISHMDNYNGGVQEMVTFKVTFPGFEPLTDKTKQCLTQPKAYWPPGCVPIEFWIGGYSKDQPVLSDDDHFNNSRDLFHSQIPKQGPDGFEMYETGPENARMETYRKKIPTHTLLFECLIFSGYQGKRDAVCENYGSPLPNGNGLSYRLSLDQIKDAEKIDDGIRSVISSFTLKGDKP